MKGLSQLTLDLSQSGVADLRLLENLKGLSQLALDLRESQVRDLKPLENLKVLNTLSITQATKGQRMSLQKIPDGLTYLSL